MDLIYHKFGRKSRVKIKATKKDAFSVVYNKKLWYYAYGTYVLGGCTTAGGWSHLRKEVLKCL